MLVEKGITMQVRWAAPADIPRVIDMIEALRAAVDGPIAVDRDWTGGVLRQLLASPSGCVFVSEGGFIAGMIQPTVISPAPVAKELGWWASDGSGLRLLRAFEAWAKERGVTLVQLSTAPDGLNLSRLGYARAELAWVR